MPTIQIKYRYTNAVLYEHETTDARQSSGLAMRDALEAASKAGVDLRGSDLSGVDLIGSDLRGSDLSGVDLRGSDLRGSDLRGADLRDSDLSGVDLSGSDLSGADLRGVKWAASVTINRAPLQLYGLNWPVTILDQHMQIGCQLHSLADWSAFDDARIAKMAGREALRFWRANKAAILALAYADERGVEAHETAQEVTQ